MSNSLPLQTVALQTPLSVGFPRLEYWSELPFPSPVDLPNPGIEPMSAALVGRFFTTEPLRKPMISLIRFVFSSSRDYSLFQMCYVFVIVSYILLLGSFRQEGKFSPCFSVLARSRCWGWCAFHLLSCSQFMYPKLLDATGSSYPLWTCLSSFSFALVNYVCP